MTPLKMLREFHSAFGLDMADSPTLVGPALAKLRQDLLDEEVTELRDAVAADDIVEIADALADIIYIALGTAVVHGIPLDEVFQAVHDSNMAKLVDGTPLYHPNGKVKKPDNWQAPDIAAILRKYND